MNGHFDELTFRKRGIVYEVFEHTADLGLRVRTAELNDLFVDAARGLFSMVVMNLDNVHPVQERTYSIESDSTDYLLFDWLNELLFAFETEQILLSQFEVEANGTELKASARGEQMDPDRHDMHHEVKAITYHGLKVDQLESGDWQAEVIVDI